MSKFTPEVGDVWEFYNKKENTTYLYHITKIDLGLAETLYLTLRENKTEFCGEVSFLLNGFDDCQYLGKSKASIKELFDVAED